MAVQSEQQVTEALKAAGKKLKEMDSLLERTFNMPFLGKLKIALTILVVGFILFFSKGGLIFKLISASLFGALIWSYFYLGLAFAGISLIYWVIQKIKGA